MRNSDEIKELAYERLSEAEILCDVLKVCKLNKIRKTLLHY